MNTDNEHLSAALAAAADVLRRADPVYCAVMGVEQITDVEWDAALALVENALDCVEVR